MYVSLVTNTHRPWTHTYAHAIQEECQPALDEALVSKLVKEVNASNDFAAFVKGMRRAFKATVKPN